MGYFCKCVVPSSGFDPLADAFVVKAMTNLTALELDLVFTSHGVVTNGTFIVKSCCCSTFLLFLLVL